MKRVTQIEHRPRLALAAAAIGAIFAGSAIAQDRAVEPRSETQIARAGGQVQTLDRYLQNRMLRVSELVDMNIQSRSGGNIGEVEDIVRGATPGQDMELIVAVGGIAGGGEKLVSIPFDEIEISADGDTLYTNSTRDQLAAAPALEWDRGSASATSMASRRLGDLVGEEVEGTDGETVAEIDDIVLSTAGADSVAAVLQVGGFAGLGEKRIALPLRQLLVERSGDGDPRIRVAIDKDTLEQQPEFRYEQHTSRL